jgi:hypothetical protein
MIISLLQVYVWSLLAGIMLGVVIQLTMSFVLTTVWVQTLISKLRPTQRRDSARSRFTRRVSANGPSPRPIPDKCKSPRQAW